MAIYNTHRSQYVTVLPDGYLVVVPGPDGAMHTRTFRDGHTPAALLSAERARDAIYETHYGMPLPKRIFHRRLRAGKASPKKSLVLPPGITYLEKKIRSRHGTDDVYVIPCLLAMVHLEPGSNYSKPKRARSKLYSLNKYSLDEALKLALEWRVGMCRQLGVRAVQEIES